MSQDQYKFLLSEQDIPTHWYNMNADMPMPPTPVLNPQTKEPITPEFLNVLFPMSLIEQEMSTERYIEIPEEVREIYKLWRPTPLIRAVAMIPPTSEPARRRSRRVRGCRGSDSLRVPPGARARDAWSDQRAAPSQSSATCQGAR